MAARLCVLLHAARALVAPVVPVRGRALRRGAGGASGDATPLSDSFEGAVADASGALLRCIGDGELRVRLDFDTSCGDATYTPLKQSMEFAREVAIEWALSLEDGEVLAVWFPDAGAAALARREWKVDDPAVALVPPNVRLAAFPRDAIEDGDAAFFALCPRAPERDATEALVVGASGTGRPVALLNPYLVDMGTTGFGMSGRMFKERLVDTLKPAYYLRTLDWGAVARTYPRAYALWKEDAAADGGYALVKRFDALPNDEDLEELYYAENSGGGGGDPLSAALGELGKFVANFGKL